MKSITSDTYADKNMWTVCVLSDDSMQNRCNSTASALELHLFYIMPLNNDHKIPYVTLL